MPAASNATGSAPGVKRDVAACSRRLNDSARSTGLYSSTAFALLAQIAHVVRYSRLRPDLASGMRRGSPATFGPNAPSRVGFGARRQSAPDVPTWAQRVRATGARAGTER